MAARLRIPKLLLIWPVILLVTAILSGESDSAPSPQVSEPSAVFRANTGMVLLDVIVTGPDGRSVMTLKEGDFTVKEKGKKQKIASFRLVNAARPAAKKAQAPSGPYIYSNKPETQSTTAAPTVLLIDGLNTTTANQQYARRELLEYAATQLRSGQLVAVYALGDTLRMLQDFTSDPRLLKAAIESYQAREPQLQAGSTVTPLSKFTLAKIAGLDNGGEMLKRKLESLQSFEEARAAPNMETRIRVTLAAFRALARIAAAYPGRKNLVWVSAGFPFTLSPDDGQITEASDRSANPTGPPPLPNAASLDVYNADLERTFIPELRATSAELAQLQVAVYPVDARGLLNISVEDASQTGLTPLGQLETDSAFGRHVQNSYRNLNSTQTNMRELARQTGGKAFVNRNDIDRAVALASQDGGTYYDIGYYPSDKSFHGEYRSLKVETSGHQNLRYRPGYFALAPEVRGSMLRAETTQEIRDPALESTVVQFSAQVPPTGADAIAHIRFLVDSRTVTAEKRQSGGRHLNLDFFAYALDANGQVKASSGKTVNMDLTDEQYSSAVQQGLLLPFDIELPVGDLRLRLAVRDNGTGYYGTLTVPVHVAEKAANK